MADPLAPVLGAGVDMATALERIEGEGRGRGARGSGSPAAGGRTRGRSRPPRA
jgi:hypothetical protein